MNRVFHRNFLFFIAFVTVCVGILIFYFVTSDHELGRIDDSVVRTYEVIAEAEQLNAGINTMLAVQRGYLLTGEEAFLEKYENEKSEVSNQIANLTELTKDFPRQQSRLSEMRAFYQDFAMKLEERANEVDTRTSSESVLTDIADVNDIKDNIMRINSALLREEYDLLNNRVQILKSKNNQYLITIISGITIGAVLLLILNAFLFRAQKKRSDVEASLKISEDRLALAMKGTQDGIFDWDVKSDKIFLSKRYYEMLGYHDMPIESTFDEIRELIHPDDSVKLFSAIDQYLQGGLSEFSQEFRMKHASGRWVWIQSKASALYDDKGKAYRMVGAHADISHLKQAQEKLENEKEQAEQANAAKSDFLAHMSHEIRTPLTAISGIAEILGKKQENFNDRQKKLIDTLGSSTDSLKDLISDILDFSKIESGELELEEDFFDIDTVFEQIVNMMSLKASEKGINFVLDYQEIENKTFHGDPVRFRQILVNLIANAIKFTGAGGKVSVEAYYEDRENEQYLRINVSDTGIGISPENFDVVFERFKQTDSSVSRKYGGTGLGLPISRNLARLMGGDIFISSEVDKGSTFTLLIPEKTKSTQSDLNGIKQYNKKLSDKIKSQLNNASKLLIVEDYEGNVVVISFILDEMGLEYDVASNGAEAVKAWQENFYSLLLMDVQMPEMDGFTATQKIRDIEKDKKLERTPIIGMTAHALVGDKDKCIKSGMDSYLPKPIVESDLKKEILRFLKKSSKAA